MTRQKKLLLFFVFLVLTTAAAGLLRGPVVRDPAFAGRREKPAGPETAVTFSADGIAVSGNGASADGNTLYILSGGCYRLSGQSGDARIVVIAKKQTVWLTLDSLDLSCAASPLFLYKAREVTVECAEGTSSFLSDAPQYDPGLPYAGGLSSCAGAVLLSGGRVVLQGSGSLTLTARCADGIFSSSDVEIYDCTLTVRSAGRGIHAASDVCVRDARLIFDCKQDDLFSDREDAVIDITP